MKLEVHHLSTTKTHPDNSPHKHSLILFKMPLNLPGFLDCFVDEGPSSWNLCPFLKLTIMQFFFKDISKKNPLKFQVTSFKLIDIAALHLFTLLSGSQQGFGTIKKIVEKEIKNPAF